MISVRRSGNGRVEVVDREVSHQENDKLMLLYGKRDEAHYEINELARRGLNLITKDTPGKPPSVFCNDPGHPRNPDLDATVTVTVNDRVKVVPVWENHPFNPSGRFREMIIYVGIRAPVPLPM